MFLTLIKFMNFSSYLHTIDMRSSQMGSVPDSSLRDWVWVIALCPWPRSFSPSTSLLLYQFVLASPVLGVILRWISFLSKGKEVVLHSLLLEVKGSTSRFVHLERFN